MQRLAVSELVAARHDGRRRRVWCSGEKTAEKRARSHSKTRIAATAAREAKTTRRDATRSAFASGAIDARRALAMAIRRRWSNDRAGEKTQRRQRSEQRAPQSPSERRNNNARKAPTGHDIAATDNAKVVLRSLLRARAQSVRANRVSVVARDKSQRRPRRQAANATDLAAANAAHACDDVASERSQRPPTQRRSRRIYLDVERCNFRHCARSSSNTPSTHSKPHSSTSTTITHPTIRLIPTRSCDFPQKKRA